jgi:hypothetical protein
VLNFGCGQTLYGLIGKEVKLGSSCPCIGASKLLLITLEDVHWDNSAAHMLAKLSFSSCIVL